MSKFFIKRNDTGAPFRVQLVDSAGDFVDLTGATVRFVMSRGTTATIAASATVTNAALGAVQYDWQPGDTTTSGTYRAEWEVTDGSGQVQTYPNPGYDEVVITPDLG